MDGIVMSEKYKDSEMHTILKGLVTVRLESAEHMGSVDFWPCSGTGCVFLPEADVINVTALVKAKLCNLAKVASKGVVLAESTAVSEQYVDSLQQLATLEMRLVTLPVTTKLDAAKILVHLMQTSHGEVIKQPSHRGPVEKALLEAVQCLPKTGTVKGKALLEKFGSLRAISLATVKELAAVVGQSSAVSIYAYFHEPFKQQK
ncbi:hypothetical protein EMCRGX_G000902 [Ephydatia muelleri]